MDKFLFPAIAVIIVVGFVINFMQGLGTDFGFMSDFGITPEAERFDFKTRTSEADAAFKNIGVSVSFK
jgi:hypothetical protein